MVKVLTILTLTAITGCSSLPNDWDISRMDPQPLSTVGQYDYVRDPHTREIVGIIEKSR